MSLQVWLPLNGDLRNLGVSNITVTNDGATIDNNGKIGKCYSFNGTNNKIIIDNFSVGNEWSYGCWLYSATSTRGWEGVIILNTNGGDSDMQLGLYTNPAGNRIQNTANGQYNSGISFTYGQWNHFLGTFDGSSLKTYINGILVNTKAITNGILSRSKLTIGARCRGSSYDTFFQGKINDVRIYDHALSAAEVHEISQGLVLHYKLDDGVTATSGNLVGNARYSQTAAAGSTWGAHRYYSTQVDLDVSAPVPWKKGTKFQLVYDTSLGSGGGGACSLGRFAAEPSTTYCYSLYINAPDDMAYIHANWMYRYEYEAAYNATAGTRIIEQGVAAKARAENLGNHWYRIWGTFTTNASTHSITFSFYTYPGKSITYYIACPQIEKGTTMTAWSGELGARRIYEDSSGYGHHGLVTGNLSSSDNSARYNNCIYMPNGQTDYITSQDNVGYFTNGITLNIWFKSTNKSPGSGYHHCFNSLSQWVYIEMAVHQNGYLRCGLYINGTRYVNNTNNTNLLDGNWHMLTMTYDGSNVKRYVDGVLKDTQAASGNLNTSSDKFIFGHGAATSYYCKEAYLSDARLYVTGLSADDVITLYHTGAKIGNHGDIHAYELNEGFGLEENAKFVNNSATSMAYDAATDTYTIVSPVGTSSWGYGVRLADTPALEVPYGMTYRWTAEVWTPVALTVNTDYNNAATSAWAGNDNDATSTRLPAGNTIPANTWTRIYRGASNTHTSNTNHLPIRDYSSLGLVTNGQSGPITWKVRHLQWYLVDTTFKPQIKKTGIIEAEHFTEVEQNLNKPAQFNKQMFSVNGNEFIEL